MIQSQTGANAEVSDKKRESNQLKKKHKKNKKETLPPQTTDHSNNIQPHQYPILETRGGDMSQNQTKSTGVGAGNSSAKKGANSNKFALNSGIPPGGVSVEQNKMNNQEKVVRIMKAKSQENSLIQMQKQQNKGGAIGCVDDQGNNLQKYSDQQSAMISALAVSSQQETGIMQGKEEGVGDGQSSSFQNAPHFQHTQKTSYTMNKQNGQAIQQSQSQNQSQNLMIVAGGGGGLGSSMMSSVNENQEMVPDQQTGARVLLNSRGQGAAPLSSSGSKVKRSSKRQQKEGGSFAKIGAQNGNNFVHSTNSNGQNFQQQSSKMSSALAGIINQNQIMSNKQKQEAMSQQMMVDQQQPQQNHLVFANNLIVSNVGHQPISSQESQSYNNFVPNSMPSQQMLGSFQDQNSTHNNFTQEDAYNQVTNPNLNPNSNQNGLFSQRSNEGLFLKQSSNTNYYSVINQTLASQVANFNPEMDLNQLQNSNAQALIQAHQAQKQKKQSQGSGKRIETTNNLAQQKRKSVKGKQHQQITKSLKDTVNGQTGQGTVSLTEIGTEGVDHSALVINEDRNAQTSVDWNSQNTRWNHQLVSLQKDSTKRDKNGQNLRQSKKDAIVRHNQFQQTQLNQKNKKEGLVNGNLGGLLTQSEFVKGKSDMHNASSFMQGGTHHHQNHQNPLHHASFDRNPKSAHQNRQSHLSSGRDNAAGSGMVMMAGINSNSLAERGVHFSQKQQNYHNSNQEQVFNLQNVSVGHSAPLNPISASRKTTQLISAQNSAKVVKYEQNAVNVNNGQGAGRNRTATALLYGSASTTGQNERGEVNDTNHHNFVQKSCTSPSSRINKNFNNKRNKVDSLAFQQLLGPQQITTTTTTGGGTNTSHHSKEHHSLVRGQTAKQQNNQAVFPLSTNGLNHPMERKQRLKTSHGTKTATNSNSNKSQNQQNQHSWQKNQQKLPLMHNTLQDHPNNNLTFHQHHRGGQPQQQSNPNNFNMHHQSTYNHLHNQSMTVGRSGGIRGVKTSGKNNPKIGPFELANEKQQRAVGSSSGAATTSQAGVVGAKGHFSHLQHKESISLSDDGRGGMILAQQTSNNHLQHHHKKPFGLIKKSKAQSNHNGGIGVTTSSSGVHTAATTSALQGTVIAGTSMTQSPVLNEKTGWKKNKKMKSVSSALASSNNPHAKASQSAKNALNSSSVLSPPNHGTSNGKMDSFLPHTGIEFPFLKKRPQFIEASVDFELLHSGNAANTRFQAAISSIPHALAARPGDYNARIVYDCTYGMGNQNGAGSSFMQAGERTSQNFSGSTTVQGGQIINGKYFDRLAQYYTVKGNTDSTLLFESRFESGNLHRATQVGEFEYDLELKFDHGSVQSLTQWYYFRVQNMRKGPTYKFNIVNLVKPDSSYNHGMKPLIYSKKDAEVRKLGWHRSGKDIKYYPSRKRSISSPQNFYTLSFQIDFTHDSDQVFFAHCYPYTYSDCILFLRRVCLPSYGKDRLRRTALCKTRAGNSVEMLIITNFLSTQDQIAERKCVIISARVHPGESNASYIMEGCVEILLGNEPESKKLRDVYVFKVIPMLNPDGVIVGNYRCSLAGLDLNRQWQNPSVKAAPEIAAMKEMVRKTLECRDVHLFVDIHGHSRAKNLFMYGCQHLQGGKAVQIHDKKSLMAHKEKVLPILMARNMDYFSYDGCSFAILKCKEATGRVVMHREFNIVNSYTLEVSFCGPTIGIYKDTHFSQRVLKEMGMNFAKTLVKFAEPATCRDALREVEDRQNGKPIFSSQSNQNSFSPNLIKKSNYLIQQVEQVCETQGKNVHELGQGCPLNEVVKEEIGLLKTKHRISLKSQNHTKVVQNLNDSVQKDQQISHRR